MRITFLFAGLIFSLMIIVPIRAQDAFGDDATRDGLRLLEIGKALAHIPETGAQPEDFVPPHWTITDRAVGDLNADGISDFALTMMLDEKDMKYTDALKKLSKDDLWTDKTFIIVVADSRGDRKIHLNAVNYNLYGDADSPARNGDGRDNFELDIKKNVLDIKISYGGMMRFNPTFHFREENPTGGDLILIGFDYYFYCTDQQPDCLPWKLSENYLTNTRVETEYKTRGSENVGADKKTSITPVKIKFMNARLTDANQKGYTRPF